MLLGESETVSKQTDRTFNMVTDERKLKQKEVLSTKDTEGVSGQ